MNYFLIFFSALLGIFTGLVAACFFSKKENSKQIYSQPPSDYSYNTEYSSSTPYKPSPHESGEIIMPNFVREQFDEGKVKSVKDIL